MLQQVRYTSCKTAFTDNLLAAAGMMLQKKQFH
jgi:hypothetical protein